MNKEYVKTNIGNIPLEDYYEIKAQQSGFSSYAEMRNSGFCIQEPEKTDSSHC